MKIVLITPAEPGERFVDGTRHGRLAQLAMPTVAAATPDEYEVSLLDEKVDSLENIPETEIAGITLVTSVANHAYDIAARLRRRGTFVVMGGPHPTALPREALQHADAVVVGDAEDTWPRVLDDFRKGRNEKIYRSRFGPLDNLRPARLDLLKPGAYPSLAVTHATRGCPFRCEFCSVPGISGGQYRHRPVQQVAQEVASMKGPLVIFWDDNLMSNKVYSEALFEALKPLKKHWIGQATMVFARDRPLVKKAAEAGCVGLFIGLESFSKESLRSVKKGFNRVDRYQEGFKNLRDHGILGGPGIVFGFEHDGPDIFDATLEGLAAHKIPAANFNILTPFPGTVVYEQMRAQKRILSSNWSHYHPNKRVVFVPKKMSPQELLDGHRYTVEKFYRPMAMLGRIARTPGFVAKGFSWFVNWHYYKVKDVFDWQQVSTDGGAVPESEVSHKVQRRAASALPSSVST